MSKLDQAIALAMEANGWDEQTAREILTENGFTSTSEES